MILPFILSASFAYIILQAKLSLLSISLYDVLEQGLPMTVVPQWFETKGRMSMVSLRLRHPTLHMSAFRISKSEECLIVKDWSKIVNDRRELLGGSNQKRSPRFGDRCICMLQYDESGELYMFYAILPEREQHE